MVEELDDQSTPMSGYRVCAEKLTAERGWTEVRIANEILALIEGRSSSRGWRSRGPPQIRTRRFPPSGSSVSMTCGHRPQISTTIRGNGSGKRFLSSAKRSQLMRARWLRLLSHLRQAHSTPRVTRVRLSRFPFTPK